jgi:16S rRNA processing protein RimM
MLVIKGDGARSGAEILVPFVMALVPEVDVPGGRLVIDPPPGLLDQDAAS